jgi:hypothetical protein
MRLVRPDLSIKVANTRDERISNTSWIAPACSQASVKATNVVWGSKRSLTGSWDAVLRVIVRGPRDDVLSLLVNASWVACGWNDSWDVGTVDIVSDEIDGRRNSRGWDRKKLAGVGVVNEAEEEALAAGMSLALGQAQCRSSCRKYN